MIKICNLCWWEVRLFNPSKIYWPNYKHHTDPKEKPWKAVWFIYKCLKCHATVWCHNDTTKPYWTLADKKTKKARNYCHNLLDPLWKIEQTWDYKTWLRWKRRKKLYKMLANKMNLPEEKTHFWMFDIAQCRIAYKIILEYKKKKRIK